MNFFETILLLFPFIFTLGRVIRLHVLRPSRLMLSLLQLLRFVRSAACPNTLETSRAVNCKRPFPEPLIPHQTTVCPPAGRPQPVSAGFLGSASLHGGNGHVKEAGAG